MAPTRWHLLIVGPMALVGLCYAIAAPSRTAASGKRVGERITPTTLVSRHSSPLVESCRRHAAVLRTQLPDEWDVLVREPFLLAGDCDEQQLAAYHSRTIQPTARALAIQYFDQPPTWPITVLLCSSDESYRECQRRFDGNERSNYSGIYSRTHHRLVVNISTGEGTLAHELTHALSHADFPDLPKWIDEGLASLNEECEFSENGRQLIGLDNWRLNALKGADRREFSLSLSDLAHERFAALDRAEIDYAHARYFCLFLQQQGLLEAFYRKCRSRIEVDPSGTAVLCELFAVTDPGEIDDQFRSWINRLIPTRR